MYGLSRQRKNAHYQGCKEICAQSERNTLFVHMENVRNILFKLMKHGTNTLYVAIVFLFSVCCLKYVMNSYNTLVEIVRLSFGCLPNTDLNYGCTGNNDSNNQ